MTEIHHRDDGWPCWGEGPAHVCTTGLTPCLTLATWRIITLARGERAHVAYYCDDHLPPEAFDAVRET